MLTIASDAQTLTTVPYVDLKKYSGNWYQIVAFPQRFQKGCICTTAEYTLTNKNNVFVGNSYAVVGDPNRRFQNKRKGI